MSEEFFGNKSAMFEQSEFGARRKIQANEGSYEVASAAGLPFFGYFLWQGKESNA